MEQKYIQTLNSIVEKDGNCLNFQLCGNCPFKKKCIALFAKNGPMPSRTERREMALDILARIELMGDVEVC